ncbi:Uma2 family endonuclease [Scytonema millei]|uniref:Uma2 family endonuclease n=1 Tax=Scytonema millei VB511283 TaxID=1245923 RepID=A0A9X5I2L0_9CYAN|nr:Uma2 family endonuclease [Scytonema millei]NHC33106.1 Uma2 family endonuclease [Scytonema millei VB511283]
MSQTQQLQDNCVTLYDISWEKFEAIAALLEDSKARLTYLDGILEIMTPSPEHEEYKTTIGYLLEVYLRFIGIRFYGRGGYTLGSREVGVRGEPDESYNLETKKEIPDIAIEVVLTSGGVDKLEKYRRWRVPEVWFYRNRQLSIYRLRSDGYEQIFRSEFLPDLDLDLLVRCLNISDQYDATVAFTQALQQQT